ncbi:MAG: hypothetical protein JO246_00545 [Frankiaceae bacterium]|nr:hypothetical protein [Frankiaceae bacterium]MBV9869603.1 hypothetical protein [Frankiaceae bacterium]
MCASCGSAAGGGDDGDGEPVEDDGEGLEVTLGTDDVLGDDDVLGRGAAELDPLLHPATASNALAATPPITRARTVGSSRRVTTRKRIE